MCAVPVLGTSVVHVGTGWVLGMGPGGYTGRVIPGYTQPPESGSLTAKRAPEPLQGVEWVVRLQRAPELAQTTTPCGRARSAVWATSPRDTRLLANKDEI